MMRRVSGAWSTFATVTVMAACLAMSGQTLAQQPSFYTWNNSMIDYSDAGGDLSCFDRPHTNRIFFYGGSLTPYLLADVGNDLNLYRFASNGAIFVADGDLGLGYNCSSAAAGPQSISYKSTDRIRGASVCPGCRFGVVHADGSDWLIDFGTGTNPGFTSSHSFSGADFGATYRVGGTQYLWGFNVNGETCGGSAVQPNPGIWVVSDDANLPGPSYCFQDRTYQPEGSVQLTQDLFLYYESASAGRGLRLATIDASGIPQPFASSVPVGSAAHFKVSQPGGFGTYPAYVVAVDAGSSVPAKVYRITSATSGLVDTGLSIPGTEWGTGAISIDASGSGFVFLAETGNGATARRGLFQVSGLAVGGAPTAQEVDYSYWNSESSDFNANLAGTTTNLVESNAIFEPGGAYLYLSRFRALQEFKYDPQAPEPPVAAGSVTVGAGQGDQNGNPYPGDTVTVSNTTVDTYDQSAIWITDQTGAVVEGSSVLSGTTPSSRAFTIPVDLAANVSYTAHVEVLDSVNFPNNPDEWALPISINRAPTASFTVTPTAVLTGESVALSATTAGTPGNPPFADNVPYHWSVSPPQNAPCPSPFQDTGNGCFTDSGSGSLTDVVLDGSGDYTFGLTVDYQHDQDNNPGVQYHAQADPQVASAAWGAPILSGTSPTTPTIDDNVSLRAFGSRLSEGMTVDYRYVLDGVDAGGTGCSGTVTGGTGGSTTVPDCVVGTLSAGQHSAQVIFTATDIDPLEVQSQTVSFNVTDTSMDFTWSLYQDNDSNGQINVGDVVRFQKTTGSNVTGWNFGASDCDGNSPVIPSLDCSLMGCNTYDWTYGSNGTFTVVMTTADGSVSHPVTIGAGSCPQSCTYSVSPLSISVGSSATSRSLSITNNQGCNWNASEALSWVTLSQTSGNGSATITITFTQNSSTSSRTGSISVTGQDGFSRTVNLSQSGTGSSGSPSFSYQLSVDRDDNGSINVGDTVSFTSTGDGTVTGWNFGAADCDGTSASLSCAVAPCPSLDWTYGSSGTFSVTMHTSAGDAAQSVTVGAGSCSGSCSYTLSPSFANVAASAGSGTFSVNTGTSCSWSATSQDNWLHVTSGSGTGSGTVAYTFDANTSANSRQGKINVQGKDFTINQAAGGGGGGTESGPLLIPAAASVQGEGGTQWKSDLRIFNPASQQLEITIQFVPQPGDETPYPTLLYDVDPSETIWIDDIMYWFAQGAASKGALIITYDPSDQGSPLITSRTYNQTDDGTFGQLIPVLSTSSLTGSGGKLYIPGVEDSDLYRTNIGLVNTGTDGAGVTVTLIDHLGNELVHAPLGIPAETYMQLGLSAIAAQDPDALDITGFKGTVVVEVTNGGSVAAYGSVVDWTTGDPIFIEAVK